MQRPLLKITALTAGMLVNLMLPAITSLIIFLVDVPGSAEGDRSYGYAAFFIPMMYVLFSVVPLLIYFFLTEKFSVSLKKLTLILLILAFIPAVIIGFIMLANNASLVGAILAFPFTIFTVFYVTIPGTLVLRFIYRKQSLKWNTT